MRQFLAANISWLYRYFDRNKGLLEIFSFLMVAQSFIYSANPQDLGLQSISALKIVLWVLIFLVILLLQLSTAVELKREGEHIFGPVFKEANFMKIIMRFLTLVLLLALVPIFVKQIETSFHNGLFTVFYGSLAFVIVLEALVYGAAAVLPKKKPER